ncbi:YceI family protein [Streptomonospora wellingtoniae]|uniref:YceI family protein n=1 Tax=Streptomonospora wellingtoniae TaxID=3075544 RepID=A0ABU2KPD4_9ACTN|nr:YceI family protein [Streptomonospora sp. DSM 45055]MDT0301130.1 YceI family protein [Streptomonospora sp. DSM 45055]
MSDQQLRPGTWRIDRAHSVVGFSVRHMMISRVRGRFEMFDAELTVPEDPLQSSVRATVDAASIDTDDAQRDARVRSADFLDTAMHPQWTFLSTGVRTSGEDFLLDGDLSVKGSTRPVVLRLEFNGVRQDASGLFRARFRAGTEISRSDFGVDIEMPMDGGGVVVADRIRIEIDAEFTHEAD